MAAGSVVEAWFVAGAASLGLLGVSATAAAQPEILDAETWRADLAETVETIREVHPRPFERIDEAEFEAAVQALDAEIPTLSDHEIMVRLAGVAGMIEDGHTRLALPRTRPDLAFSYSHSTDEPPADPALAFGQLPVVFDALEDGLFIGRAEPGFEHLVAMRVDAFGDLAADEAMTRAGAFVSAENAGGRALNAADRLMLPEVLGAIGVDSADCGYRLALTAPDGAGVLACLQPLSGAAPNADAADTAPFRIVEDADHPGLVIFEFDQVAAGENAEIGEVFRDAVRRAAERDARLVIDLRENTGGSGTYWRPVAMALTASEEVNAYGRVFVLTGPRTFSAAQSLLNHLELFTRALFVGEPSGARPDHFGDSRKTRLANSGLTLRVSTLHWSSGTGGDVREATMPHIPAPRRSEDVFTGRDAALEAAASWEFPGVGALIADQLRREHVFNAANIGVMDALARPAGDRLSVEDYLSLAETLRADEDLLASAYMLQIGTLAHPGHEALQSRFEEALEGL